MKLLPDACRRYTFDQRCRNSGSEIAQATKFFAVGSSGVPRGVWGVQTPPEIMKALQNRVKLNPIVKTVKIAEFRAPIPQDVRKKGSKILKLPRFATVLH